MSVAISFARRIYICNASLILSAMQTLCLIIVTDFEVSARFSLWKQERSNCDFNTVLSQSGVDYVFRLSDLRTKIIAL